MTGTFVRNSRALSDNRTGDGLFFAERDAYLRMATRLLLRTKRTYAYNSPVSDDSRRLFFGDQMAFSLAMAHQAITPTRGSRQGSRATFISDPPMVCSSSSQRGQQPHSVHLDRHVGTVWAAAG